MPFETWMTALQWFIYLWHYLLLMENVLKSNGSITAAGLFCLILQNFLSHMLFLSALDDHALCFWLFPIYVFNYVYCLLWIFVSAAIEGCIKNNALQLTSEYYINMKNLHFPLYDYMIRFEPADGLQIASLRSSKAKLKSQFCKQKKELVLGDLPSLGHICYFFLCEQAILIFMYFKIFLTVKPWMASIHIQNSFPEEDIYFCEGHILPGNYLWHISLIFAPWYLLLCHCPMQ